MSAISLKKLIKVKVCDYLSTPKTGKLSADIVSGLAIAHQIVLETHGGELKVQSAFGKGLEFRICL